GTGAVSDGLNYVAELDPHRAGQIQAVVRLEHLGDTALARLAVDADDGLVGPADVLRVDGQVGHLPGKAARAGVSGPGPVVQGGQALADGVLVGTGERGV